MPKIGLGIRLGFEILNKIKKVLGIDFNNDFNNDFKNF